LKTGGKPSVSTLINQEMDVDDMTYFIVGITALLASGLTLFSGFGLNTILLPVFVLFFPIEIAVVMTAFVHIANNAFKLAIVGGKVDLKVALRFGLPAIITAYAGAWLLTKLSSLPAITTYSINQYTFNITAINVIIGILMIAFSVFELLPRFEKMEIDEKWLPLGGLISGFFGGLSGHQGAVRSVFLSKAKLDKESFIATGIIISFMIDITRLSVYFGDIARIGINADWYLVGAAMLSAFAGAFIGSRFIKKITFNSIRMLVGVMLISLGILIAAGLI
jgi:uncharacterized protein